MADRRNKLRRAERRAVLEEIADAMSPETEIADPLEDTAWEWETERTAAWEVSEYDDEPPYGRWHGGWRHEPDPDPYEGKWVKGQAEYVVSWGRTKPTEARPEMYETVTVDEYRDGPSVAEEFFRALTRLGIQVDVVELPTSGFKYIIRK